MPAIRAERCNQNGVLAIEAARLQSKLSAAIKADHLQSELSAAIKTEHSGLRRRFSADADRATQDHRGCGRSVEEFRQSKLLCSVISFYFTNSFLIPASSPSRVSSYIGNTSRIAWIVLYP